MRNIMIIDHTKFSFLLFICLGLILTSCSQTDYESYQAQKFEIDYLNIDGLQEHDWIEIDGIRFNHVRPEKRFINNVHEIPTSIVLKDSLAPNNKVEAQFNSLAIGIMLGNKMRQVVTQDSVRSSTNSEILITKPPLLMSMGKLRIIKQDSSSFEVKTSKNYPAKVTPLEF